MSAPSAEVAEERVQEDLLRLDTYRGQLNAMVQQHQYLSASRADHLRARESLEGLERLGDAGSLLIPVGGETYVHGAATPGTKVVIGVGSGLVVELDRPKAIEILADRLTKIDKATQDLEGQIRMLEERIQLISQRIDRLSRGADGETGELPADDVAGD